MAVNRAALDALEQLLGGAVRRMDPGDVAPSPAAQRQALESLAPAADDWGWKGGKPGEITGGMYVGELNDAFKRLAKGNPNNPRWLAAEAGIYEKYDPKVLGQIEKSGNTALKEAWGGDVDEFMESMKMLEDADIPREWTGKIYPVLRSRLTRWERITPAMAQAVSDVMRPMTNDQRKVFLDWLPSWEEDIETLAKTVRNL